MTLKIFPHLFKDWRTIFPFGLTVGYIALLYLFVIHSEELWRTVALLFFGGVGVYTQWEIALQYLSIEQGYLELYPKFPFPLISSKNQQINLSKMRSATITVHAVNYYNYQRHAVPAIVFTANDLQATVFAVPLPFGRTIHEPEVLAFGQALNDEIRQIASHETHPSS